MAVRHLAGVGVRLLDAHDDARPRPRNDIDTVMRRFAIRKAALRRDNRLELLLRTVRWR